MPTRSQKIDGILDIAFDGKIPVSRLSDLPRVTSHIEELLDMATGGPRKSVSRGQMSAEAERLYTQIKELYESGETAGSWQNVAKALADMGVRGRHNCVLTGDACRKRYYAGRGREPRNGPGDEAAAASTITQDDPADGAVEADRSCEPEAPAASVEVVADHDITKDILAGLRCRGCGKPISEAYKAYVVNDKGDNRIYCSINCRQKDPLVWAGIQEVILNYWREGMTSKKISEALETDHGTVMPWTAVRATIASLARDASAKSSESGNPSEAEPTEKVKKEVLLSDADTQIILMKRRGAMDIEIAQTVQRKFGGSWDGPKVAARLKELEAEGL